MTTCGTPRAKCNDCHKTFALNPKSRAITPEKEAAIERHLNERTSIRGICRALKVSPNTVYMVYVTLKKVEKLPDFETSVLPAQKGDSTECDELWAFVGSKKQQAWIWLSWSFLTTQTLSFAIGARDLSTGKGMWQGIPASSNRKQVYTDGFVWVRGL